MTKDKKVYKWCKELSGPREPVGRKKIHFAPSITSHRVLRSDGTVQVMDGEGWRSGGMVEMVEMERWRVNEI